MPTENALPGITRLVLEDMLKGILKVKWKNTKQPQEDM